MNLPGTSQSPPPGHLPVPMQGRQRRKRPNVGPRHDEGVSTVLGAVLLLGILVLFLVMVQVTYVPVWEADNEARHLQRVSDQMSTLDATIEQQSPLGREGSFSQNIQMAPETGGIRFGIFQPTSLPGQLSLQPMSAPVSVSTNQFLVQQDGSRPLFALDETWETYEPSDRIEGVEEFAHFRIRYIDPASQPRNSPEGATHHATVTVIDADGVFAGEMRITIESYPSEYAFRMRVLNAVSAPLFDQVINNHHLQTQPSFYWINLLNDDYFFSTVLSGTKAPYDLVLSSSGVNAQYAVAYTAQGVQLGGSGQMIPDFNQMYGGGSLRFHANTMQMPEWNLQLEHGAVIIEQPDGAAFLVPPDFEVGRVGAIANLRVELLTLGGEERELAGNQDATLRIEPRSQSVLQGQVPRFTLSLETAYPQLWTQFWAEEMAAAGFTLADNHFTLDSTSDSATLNFFGLVTNPASTQYDISLTLIHREAHITIQG